MVNNCSALHVFTFPLRMYLIRMVQIVNFSEIMVLRKGSREKIRSLRGGDGCKGASHSLSLTPNPQLNKTLTAKDTLPVGGAATVT